MSLHYIIDGYNVINHALFTSARKKMNSPQFALVELIRGKRLCGSLKNEVTIVFDGYCNELTSSYADKDIKLIFSQEQTADDKIKILIERSSNKKNVVVVSEDREIVSYGKSAGCNCLDITEFICPSRGLRRGNKGTSVEKNLSKQDLNYSQTSKINEELRNLWLN